jgi:hypothetical protein
MHLTSPAFENYAEVPARYTCLGKNLSPPLMWDDLPRGTRSLALIVDDPDAPDPAAPSRTWVHWVVYDLAPDPNRLTAGQAFLPGVHVGVNDWGDRAYGGPCPPVGRHRYFFKLYAVDRLLGPRGALTAGDLEHAMQGHVLGRAILVGTFQK